MVIRQARTWQDSASRGGFRRTRARTPIRIISVAGAQTMIAVSPRKLSSFSPDRSRIRTALGADRLVREPARCPRVPPPDVERDERHVRQLRIGRARRLRAGYRLAAHLRRDLGAQSQTDSPGSVGTAVGSRLGPLLGPDQARNYINFYAYMHKVVDEHIGSVLDAIEATPQMLDDTVIVRMSDHGGEMGGMSHGGLRQKVFNAYEETLRVPLVISNPLLFPEPVRTDALASLIDVMPTLATLAQAPARQSWNFLGTDLTPVIVDAAAYPKSPSAQVQDTILFTYDDQNCATPDGQNIVTQPNHIRCIRESRWKYTMYFDPAGVAAPQYELYDLQADPLELNNLANPLNIGSYRPDLAAQMNAKLFAVMETKGVSLKE